MSDHFSIGSITIYYYSLCLLAAVWVGYGLAVRLGKSYHLSAPIISDIVALLLVSGVIGGRIGFLLQNIPYFRQQPSEILRLTSGGLSIHGAIVLGAIALFWYAKMHQLSVRKLADLVALPLLAGQIIGRLGNYFNQELFGYPTALPWAVTIEPAYRPAGYFSAQTFHPTFAYEMILHGFGLLLLWSLRSQLKKPGQLALAYLIVFSVSRFITELFRISDRLLWQLSLAQIISFITATIASALLYRSLRRKNHEIIKSTKIRSTTT
jgi:phosphatidylglycerol:prolipoprotein diacylglycerol transferase